ncbi:phosphodiester glycosidase family protein [Paenibacillus sp. LHD-117]|uniref:phosphodiester glycosidase family protein n=1 Tax=Paenibacillus sp. LHD-117 TaxID=3071412 RepID=UPI0027E07824|nr:phosphodiester glycosidase family protein [Paenibacillus sp. LHD-117]MDQ6423449.1 phosphodiester glycosidase family protein [Paenibacillus sp. LHD-117]
MIPIIRLGKKNKIIIIIAALLLIIAVVLYRLADRYLIEHFEVIVEPSTVATGETTFESDQETTEEPSTTEAQSDDWNYKDDNQTISIKKVQTGSGSNMVTYYVADVTLSESANLSTAFAKNAFGTNIIEDTSTIAEGNNAVFAINGDYYGFRSDGVIIRNGTLYRDEPARDGLALFSDGTLKAYDEEETSSDALLAEGVTNTFSFGPVLVTDGEVVGDFSSVKIDKNFGNRSIQEPNPRTGIGIIAPNHFLFIVVDGRSSESRGMTLTEFANLFQELGATEAYNLDGGGSSTMYFMGRIVNNPLGKGNERGVSDIIYIPKSQ